MTPFEKIIKEHLEKKAGSDAVFAEKFIERCKADQKAIEGCCAYITAEAKKKAVKGCAVIADDEVFGWAIHYFDENLSAPATAPAARIEAAPTTEQLKAESLERGRKAVSVPVATPKAKKVDDVQLTLW